ncbi:MULTISPECIES: PhzF family phenazine biosynthesis protein [unclassified Pseudonocardia]|jgi:PhzF family phenazine biosynthesis protein|uniref:PhzF family phenazine biosynthesis protein n=1 Tax=unclassified Pseudonocardia TaxID=2619320 RepID=UPI00095F7E1C|nr:MULTISPECIES: PhzF family phenazine biosynthesis protein [unclassified Pseudonocardia]MBN9099662.1 PhzF family phenazine biosynthesis protein [Pseudonocardia sp.]OJY44996.1 MAG: oxidoreductase [Pseudonocardia sp. 73-21]
MRIRTIDAFTDRPFAGNPAGVVLLDGPGWPSEDWMQQVAAEMNLAETAFAHPLPEGGDADWALRWFTPALEVNLCGHATLATTHALHSDGLLHGTVRFTTRSGVLRAGVDGGRITLDFPIATLSAIPEPEGLADAVGAAVVGVHNTGSLGDLLVEVADEKAVRAADPDLPAILRMPWRGVIVTAAGDGDHDYVSRFFAPGAGIAEDPVTGSAHTALAPFWSTRLGRPELVGLQASRRSGLVHTTVAGDRVLLAGEAVTVLDGNLLIEA